MKNNDTTEKLIEEIDRLNPYQTLSVLRTSKNFQDDNDRINELFRVVLFAKILGKRPFMVLKILNILAKIEKKSDSQWSSITRAEIAAKLGKTYTSGSPYVELGKCLEILVQINAVKEESIEGDKGSYSLGNFILHITSGNVTELFDNRGFLWTFEELYDLLDKNLMRNHKIRDLDGIIQRPEPSLLIESLIRSGCNLYDSLSILEMIPQPSNGVWSKGGLIQEISCILEDKFNKDYSSNFLKNQPLEISISGGEFDGKLLDYETTEKIVLRILNGHEIYCAPRSIVSDVSTTFLSILHGNRDRRVKDDALVEGLSSRFNTIYGMNLETLKSKPAEYVEKSKRFSDISKAEAEMDQPARAFNSAKSALYNTLAAILVVHNTLPDKDEDSTLGLFEHLLRISKADDTRGIPASSAPKLICYPENHATKISSLLRKNIENVGILVELEDILGSRIQDYDNYSPTPSKIMDILTKLQNLTKKKSSD